jgi:hypothetical protein
VSNLEPIPLKGFSKKACRLDATPDLRTTNCELDEQKILRLDWSVGCVLRTIPECTQKKRCVGRTLRFNQCQQGFKGNHKGLPLQKMSMPDGVCNPVQIPPSVGTKSRDLKRSKTLPPLRGGRGCKPRPAQKAI